MELKDTIIDAIKSAHGEKKPILVFLKSGKEYNGIIKILRPQPHLSFHDAP